MKLALSDSRMLDLMKFVIDNNIKGISTQQNFFKSIGFKSANNLSQIKNGKQSFRIEHLSKACELYGVDGNFFLNKKHTAMFVTGEAKQPTAIQKLKQAIAQMEAELKK